MTPEPISFETKDDFDTWMSQNHHSDAAVFVRLYKVKSGVPSITWNDLVEVVLCWGWIDGLKKSYDDQSYLQRITPRRPRSIWSARNVAHVERLMGEGRMQPTGLAQVEAAKSDGRWAAAYGGPVSPDIPADFRAAVARDPKAQETYDRLARSALTAISYQILSAKKPATRAARIERMVARLAAGDPPV